MQEPGAPPPGDGVRRELPELSLVGKDETEDQLSVLQQIYQHIEGTVESRQEAGEVAHNSYKK